MGLIKFGWKHRDKPTPQSISKKIDWICTCLGIISGWAVSAEYIPSSFSDIFSSISTMLIIPILLSTKKLWSVDTDIKKVPIDKVSEIKDDQISK